MVLPLPPELELAPSLSGALKAANIEALGWFDLDWDTEEVS